MTTIASSRATSTASADAQPGLLPAIAKEVVRLHKEAFGRGPARIAANLADPDTIVIVIEGTLTATERTLVTLGGEPELRTARAAIDDALEPAVQSVVEQTLGRRVRSFVSGLDARRGIAVDVLCLEREQLTRET